MIDLVPFVSWGSASREGLEHGRRNNGVALLKVVNGEGRNVQLGRGIIVHQDVESHEGWAWRGVPSQLYKSYNQGYGNWNTSCSKLEAR